LSERITVNRRSGAILGAVNTVDELVSNLFPGYFALVMATGIVSIAAHLLGMTWIAFMR
jgi:hypothetical protein